MVHSKKGGHCGFIFHQIGSDENPIPSNSWAPAEMARFISHVMTTA
jgi:predicted alpha/beta-fold hydrolase